MFSLIARRAIKERVPFQKIFIHNGNSGGFFGGLRRLRGCASPGRLPLFIYIINDLKTDFNRIFVLFICFFDILGVSGAFGL